MTPEQEDLLARRAQMILERLELEEMRMRTIRKKITNGDAVLESVDWLYYPEQDEWEYLNTPPGESVWVSRKNGVIKVHKTIGLISSLYTLTSRYTHSDLFPDIDTAKLHTRLNFGMIPGTQWDWRSES